MNVKWWVFVALGVVGFGWNIALADQAPSGRANVFEEQHRRLEALEAENARLLREVRRLNAESLERAGTDNLDKQGRQIRKLEAEVMQAERHNSSLPRKTFVGAEIADPEYANYTKKCLCKIEQLGTKRFPSDPGTGKLYGDLLVVLEIRSDGVLNKVKIARSSGKPELDSAAVNIAKLASPFEAFTPEMNKKTDILSISRTWRFTKTKNEKESLHSICDDLAPGIEPGQR